MELVNTKVKTRMIRRHTLTQLMDFIVTTVISSLKKSDNLHEHYLSEHSFSCPACNIIFRTLNKLNRHLCKLEVDNPSFRSFLTRGWFDLKGCNQVNCSVRDQQVAILHCEECVKEENSCCWAPYELSRKSEEIIHLQTNNIIKHSKMSHIEILWPQLSEQIL